MSVLKKKKVKIKDLFQFSLFNTENVINKKNNKKKLFIKIYLKVLNILNIFNNNLSLKLNKNLIAKKSKFIEISLYQKNTLS